MNPTTPIADLKQAIEESPNLNPADFQTIGSYTYIPVQVRQEGAESQSWKRYAVRAADDGYLSGTETQFHLIAEGYGTTPSEVWEALRNDSTLVVVDALAVPTKSGFRGGDNLPEFQVEGLFYEDESMTPIPIEVREPATGATISLTVVGVLDETRRRLRLSGQRHDCRPTAVGRSISVPNTGSPITA